MFDKAFVLNLIKWFMRSHDRFYVNLLVAVIVILVITAERHQTADANSIGIKDLRASVHPDLQGKDIMRDVKGKHSIMESVENNSFIYLLTGTNQMLVDDSKWAAQCACGLHTCLSIKMFWVPIIAATVCMLSLSFCGFSPGNRHPNFDKLYRKYMGVLMKNSNMYLNTTIGLSLQSL